MNDSHTGTKETNREIVAGVSAANLAATAGKRDFPSLVLRPGALAALRLLQPVRRLGAWGGAGLGLVAFSIIALVLAVLPAIGERNALQAQLSAAQSAGSPALPSADVSPRSFLSKLPGRAGLPAILATIAAQAEAAHLELHEGSYEMIEGKGGAGPRYQLTLPVNGRYVDVRKFVDGTLAAVPAAALDSISLSRDDINSATVAADLRFLVFLRGRP